MKSIQQCKLSSRKVSRDYWIRGAPGVINVCRACFSGNEDYSGEVTAAAKELWDGEGTGCFVFTSSGGVYDEKDGGIVREVSPVGASPRNAKLLQAEASCLEVRF